MTPHEQQAEELARLTADKIAGWVLSERDYEAYLQDKKDIKSGTAKVLEQLPIIYWLACQQTLRQLEQHQLYSSLCQCETCISVRVALQALQSLNNWRKDKENK